MERNAKEMQDQLNCALYALGLMYNQYCSEHGHLWMAAGETAQDELERHGLLSGDATGRGLIDWDKLDGLLKEIS